MSCAVVLLFIVFLKCVINDFPNDHILFCLFNRASHLFLKCQLYVVIYKFTHTHTHSHTNGSKIWGKLLSCPLEAILSLVSCSTTLQHVDGRSWEAIKDQTILLAKYTDLINRKAFCNAVCCLSESICSACKLMCPLVLFNFCLLSECVAIISCLIKWL